MAFLDMVVYTKGFVPDSEALQQCTVRIKQGYLPENPITSMDQLPTTSSWVEMGPARFISRYASMRPGIFCVQESTCFWTRCLRLRGSPRLYKDQIGE